MRPGHQDLYFAKVDVKACFDTLPQDRLVALATNICMSHEYSMTQYTEFKPGPRVGKAGQVSKPLKKFHTRTAGYPADRARPLNPSGNNHHPDAVLLDNVARKTTHREDGLRLLRQHIQGNVIKIGKRFWRQKRGIAQGSVLSSLLCSLCYAEFEKEHLSFLTRPFLFMRLIDDFLLITPLQQEATRFLEVMFGGIKDYGIEVRPEKCLTNFDAKVGDVAVSRLQGSGRFPYCGMLIDEKTLDILKDPTPLGKSGQLVMKSRHPKIAC